MLHLEAHKVIDPQVVAEDPAQDPAPPGEAHHEVRFVAGIEDLPGGLLSEALEAVPAHHLALELTIGHGEPWSPGDKILAPSGGLPHSIARSFLPSTSKDAYPRGTLRPEWRRETPEILL